MGSSHRIVVQTVVVAVAAAVAVVAAEVVAGHAEVKDADHLGRHTGMRTAGFVRLFAAEREVSLPELSPVHGMEEDELFRPG